MSKKVKEFPFCSHDGSRDCFACDSNCKCNLLTDTNFRSSACPFYKSRYSVKPFKPIQEN